MCGLYGFKGSEFNVQLLSHLTDLAKRRGPHGGGVAYLTPNGDWKRVVVRRGVPTIDRAARVVVGHFRLTTYGSYNDENLQPFHDNELVVAHNGNLGEIESLRSHAHIDVDASDTRAAFTIISKLQPVDAAQQLASFAGNHPIAAVVADRERVIGISKGLPLHIIRRSEGVYYCSWPFSGSTRVTSISSLD